MHRGIINTELETVSRYEREQLEHTQMPMLHGLGRTTDQVQLLR